MLTRSSIVVAVLASFALGAFAQSKAPAEPSAKEKTAVQSAFTRADANGDGKLSKEEATKLPAVAAKFEDLDKNKDGSLSSEEFAAGFMTGG